MGKVGNFKIDVRFASLFPKRTCIRIIFKLFLGGSGLWAPERSTGPLGPPETPAQDVGWSPRNGPRKGFLESVPGKGTEKGSQKGFQEMEP